MGDRRENGCGGGLLPRKTRFVDLLPFVILIVKNVIKEALSLANTIVTQRKLYHHAQLCISRLNACVIFRQSVNGSEKVRAEGGSKNKETRTQEPCQDSLP